MNHTHKYYSWPEMWNVLFKEGLVGSNQVDFDETEFGWGHIEHTDKKGEVTLVYFRKED